jgi:hypothetical protein
MGARCHYCFFPVIITDDKDVIFAKKHGETFDGFDRVFKLPDNNINLQIGSSKYFVHISYECNIIVKVCRYPYIVTTLPKKLAVKFCGDREVQLDKSTDLTYCPLLEVTALLIL